MGSRFSIGRIIAALIVAVWVGVAANYAYRNLAYSGGSKNDNAPLSPEVFGEEWYSIIYKGEKAGWTRINFSQAPNGYKFDSSTLLKMTLQGQSIEVKIEVDADVDGKFDLQKFAVDFNSEVQNLYIEGEVVDNVLTYRIQSPKGSTPSERKIILDEPPQLMDMVGRNIARGGIKIGDKFETPVFDPLTQSSDKAVAKVDRKENVVVGSKSIETYVVTVEYKGIRMTSWIDDKGRAVKSEGAMGFSTLMVSREEAMNLGSGDIDLIASASIKVDKQIPNARLIKYLKVKFSGVDDFANLSLAGGDQKFEDHTLEVAIPDLGQGYKLPDSDPGRAKERSPEELIQSDDAAIGEAAKDAVGDATDSIVVAERLNSWVFDNIEKANAVSIPSAREVLKTKKGDCNEHTQLYVAMARSIGLPARVAAGLVYLDGSFYYHAWPEVWLSDTAGWTPVEPTFGVFPADATHLRFVSGAMSSQAEIVRFVGKLKIEVIEYR